MFKIVVTTCLFLVSLNSFAGDNINKISTRSNKSSFDVSFTLLPAPITCNTESGNNKNNNFKNFSNSGKLSSLNNEVLNQSHFGVNCSSPEQVIFSQDKSNSLTTVYF